MDSVVTISVALIAFAALLTALAVAVAARMAAQHRRLDGRAEAQKSDPPYDWAAEEETTP